jgi:hypothetical protein
MKHVDDHVEMPEKEAKQASDVPQTQYVLGFSLAGVVIAFGLLSLYWWWN